MDTLFDSIPLPACAAQPVSYPCGDGVQMLLFDGIPQADTEAYADAILTYGFSLVDKHSIPGSFFATFRNNALTLVINYFDGQLRLIADPFTDSYKLEDPCPRTEKTTLWQHEVSLK